MLQHHLHTGPLVVALALRLEILLGGEDLADGQAIVPEKAIIEVHQADLADGGIQLALLYAVQVVVQPQLRAAAGHGAGAHEHHRPTRLAQADHLIHERGHARDIQRAVRTRQHIRADFDYNAFQDYLTNKG